MRVLTIAALLAPVTGGWETVTVTGPQQTVVAANRSIAVNQSLRFADGGGFFINAGVTLTINGDLADAPLQQVFAGPGRVRFGAGAVERVLPQWFGCHATGKMDCTDAVQSAIDSVQHWSGGDDGLAFPRSWPGGGEIFFPAGAYPVRGITAGSFIALRGANQKASVIVTCFNCGDPAFPAPAKSGPCECVGDEVQSPGQIPSTCNCTAALALRDGEFTSWAEKDTKGPDGFNLDGLAVSTSACKRLAVRL